ncbi:MAG: 3-phosphoshikimate 1-carboxyvinyltransferase, partial [Thermoplasmata archaeon]
MTEIRVAPGTVTGSLRAPPSKSYTHRALVAGHLAQRSYAVDRPLDAEDTRATARALRPLGSRVRFSLRRWTVAPAPVPGGEIPTLDCG